MLGNGFGNLLGNVLAALLINVYNFLYEPDDFTGIFLEFNDYIWRVYNEGWFGRVLAITKIIGIGLLAASFLVSLLDKVTDGDLTIEVWFRHLLKYCMLFIILMNVLPLFKSLLQLSTSLFTEFNVSISSEVLPQTGRYINQAWLANGINKHIGASSKFGMFMMLTIPYVISLIFAVILYFFATSRLIEIVIRIALAPLVVGVSFFGHGSNLDIVRYTKRTMGIFFQIVVVLVICAGMTFTHNALITADSPTAANGAIMANPAASLKLEDGMREIEVDGEWQNATKQEIVENLESTMSYTKSSISQFVYYLLDPSHYFVSTALMLAALFMIFKSRAISTQLFG